MRRADKFPERPVTSVKPHDKKLTPAPGRPARHARRHDDHSGKISNCVAFRCAPDFRTDGAKSPEVDVLEIRSRGAELLDEAQEVVRSAADRIAATLGFRKCCVGQQLLRGRSER